LPGDPNALARACADAMWADDRATQALGMELLEVGPGRARLRMAVTEAMVNGHGICHGGYIFTLADSAFAFACNTYGKPVVASHCSIAFASPAKQGDRLIADAREILRKGRSGIYDVSVVTAEGARIAEFRGHSREINRPKSGGETT
jgi:acyl-CoA thioesterase